LRSRSKDRSLRQLLQGPRAIRESGRKAAGGGNPLPLFWHCRLADARKGPVYGLFLIGTRLAMFTLRKIRSPEGFPT
ncbi:hypothetical protein, partial [Pseudomonas sp. 10S4]|uniref:hypothetical protein n=1 Tax=Pseudomonas sp. 10S4 TaxID=3048583 RepID=UPI002B221F9B